MACIAADDCPQFSVFARHCEDRQLMVRRPNKLVLLAKLRYLAFFIVAAIHGKVGLADSPRKLRRLASS